MATLLRGRVPVLAVTDDNSKGIVWTSATLPLVLLSGALAAGQWEGLPRGSC